MRKRKWAGAQATMTNEATERCKRLLTKRLKGELVDFIVEVARADSGFRRTVESRFGVTNSSEELIEGTRRAIAAATDFDDRELNSNFDYDSKSYQIVKQNFARLAKVGKYVEVMELSLQLMREGSYQVECSDEGMMTDEIQDCLRVVIDALKKSDLAPSGLVVWCDQMLKGDRVGFICQEELRALQQAASSS